MALKSDFNDFPHRRYNPLSDSWVLVSPHRAKRPWQGQVEKLPPDQRPAHDPDCYLCAGNIRANGEQNPDYQDVFVFDNDFASLLKDSPDGIFAEGDLFKAEMERGIGRVVCFSPRHDLTIPEMEVADVRKVVDEWIAEYQSLGATPFVNYVQIFENKGAIMGCSNPHPHGQIWAQHSIPDEPLKKQKAQLKGSGVFDWNCSWLYVCTLEGGEEDDWIDEDGMRNIIIHLPYKEVKKRSDIRPLMLAKAEERLGLVSLN
jgi:UDPglucose--hexose-1-phosphate uridylyltransferase